ncbi:transposase family protein [Carboxylicivirga marina]|uniref:transposase family protein n=1 Tax=Carboxylicivirga marina TaxID=2800988 RepID=UPI00259193E0|nr:transposase family protein [uncultured Carboxylicivirga sp.]
MSTRLLHHGFGLNDQEYLKTEYKGGVVYFHIRTNEEKLQCSQCHSFNVIKKGTIERLFLTVPIGLKPVMLKAQIQRLECKDCGLVRQERIRFAEEKKATPEDSLDM